MNTSISFWQTINLLITKPHVINKRIWGCNIVTKLTCQCEDFNWEHAIHNLTIEDASEVESFIKLLLSKSKFLQINQNQVTEEEHRNIIEVILIELLPKTFTESHCFQLVCLRKDKLIATFYNVTPKEFNQKLCPNFTYSFQLLDEAIVIPGSYGYYISNSD